MKKRKQMLARQQQILSQAKAEKRALTAEEQNEFDSLQSSIEAMDAAVAAARSHESGEDGEGEGSGDGNGAEGEGSGDGNGAEGEEGGRSLDDARQRAIQDERQRVRTITEMCRDLDVDPQPYVDDGSSPRRHHRTDEAR